MAGDRDKSYYAFTLGSWRIYAVNSNCARVSCAEGSPQEHWLRQDLAEHQGMCQLMFMHHPYVASTSISPINGRTNTFSTQAVKPIWQAFYDAGGIVMRFRNAGDTTGTQWEHYSTHKAWTLLGGDGEKTVYVRFMDAAGNVSSAFADRIVLDAQAPGDSSPPRVGSGLCARHEERAGEADVVGERYHQRSGQVSGAAERYLDGAWQPQSWVTSGTTSTSLYRLLAPGRSGKWSVRQTAVDLGVKAYQEASWAITYVSSWRWQEVPSTYGGYTAYAIRWGYSATFSFRGSQVAWVAPRSSNRGYAYVYLDGAKVATVNLYSSFYLARRLVFVRTRLDPRVQHTLRVYVTGTRPWDRLVSGWTWVHSS